MIAAMDVQTQTAISHVAVALVIIVCLVIFYLAARP